MSKKSTGMLFDDPTIKKDVKVCRVCLQEKHYSKFQKRPDTFDKLDTRCKRCKSLHGKECARIKKICPPKPVDGLCECCRKPPKYWALDHDHDTRLFRGWLCRDCNQTLGKLGDNLEGVMRAANYLKMAKKRSLKKKNEKSDGLY